MDLSTFAPALRDLDLSDAQRDINERVAELARLEAALEAGKVRLRANGDTLMERKISGPDPQLAAEAILEGGTIVDATADIDRLEAEGAALRSGIRTLTQRRDDQSSSVQAARREMAELVGATADQLSPELVKEFDAAVRRVVAAYAAMVAVADATQAPTIWRFIRKVQPIVAEIAESRMVPRVAHVPTEVLDLLHAGEAAISRIRRSIKTEVDLPRVDHGDAFRSGMIAARAAQA